MGDAAVTPVATAAGLPGLGPSALPGPGDILVRPPAATPAVPDEVIVGGPPPSLPNVVRFTEVPTVDPGVVRSEVPVISSLVYFTLTN